MNDHYNPEFISAQRAALLKEKERLEKEIESVAFFDESQGRYVPKYEETSPGETESTDETADETTTFGENTAMADSLIQSLNETLSALKDIDAGKYGYCENCGGYISEERLKVYPVAKTCIKCE